MLFSDANYSTINRQAKDKVVVLPFGAIEQHDPHLPVSTDADIVSQIALQAEKQLEDDVLLCPTLPYGSGHHHLSFGGSVVTEIEVPIGRLPVFERIKNRSFKNLQLKKGESVSFGFTIVKEDGNKTISTEQLNKLANDFAKK